MNGYNYIKNRLTLNRLVEVLSSNEKSVEDFIPKKGDPLYGFVAIRTDKNYTDKYSDFLLHIQGYELLNVYACTTKAGRYYVYNPITYGGITGTAVLAPGTYYNTWQCQLTYRFGFKSKELFQVKPVKIGRDGNRNNKIDYTNIQEGFFGINIHIGGVFLSPVWNWSAGCIVVPKEQWFILEPELIINGFYDLRLIEL